MAADGNNISPKILFIKYWLPVLFYAIFIFLVSSVPGEDIPSVFSGQDIFFHILEYAGLAIVFTRAHKASRPGLKFKQRFILTVLIVFLYALSDEFHQNFTLGRNASGQDLFFDLSGILLSGLFYR